MHPPTDLEPVEANRLEGPAGATRRREPAEALESQIQSPPHHQILLRQFEDKPQWLQPTEDLKNTVLAVQHVALRLQHTTRRLKGALPSNRAVANLPTYALGTLAPQRLDETRSKPKNVDDINPQLKETLDPTHPLHPHIGLRT